MRQIIKKEQVRVDEVGVTSSARQPGRTTSSRHQVELVRVDGQVRALEVRCSCGEVSVIELTYGATTAPQEKKS